MERLWWELQWRPVSGRWIRPDQEPDSAGLVDRSRPMEGTRARLLSPVDNLLQVALHLAKHSYVRAPGLRLHTDVDRVVRRQPIDWEAFAAELRSMDFPHPVAIEALPWKWCNWGTLLREMHALFTVGRLSTRLGDRRIWSVCQECGRYLLGTPEDWFCGCGPQVGASDG